MNLDQSYVVKDFFSAFGKGDLQGILNTFHDNTTIISVRPVDRNNDELYGTYKGKSGVKKFVETLGKTFETKDFSVDHVIGHGDIVFASGSFKHILKSTGKPFASTWALKCIIRDGKIFDYQFFEDSALFEQANRQ